jgi:multidrug efflux pump subunit AcrB
VSGAFNSIDDLKRINLYANGKFFRLAAVASISKGYSDPPQPMFRFNGEPAIGLAISMAQGGNNLVFGEAVAHKMEQIIGKLPIGIEAHLVADQPVVVEEPVGGFTKAAWLGWSWTRRPTASTSNASAGLTAASPPMR